MIEKKRWDEFRATGLLLIINQILHIFGWSIVVNENSKGEVVDVFPARTKFRGFDNSETANAYKKLSKWMAHNADTLLNETLDED